MPNANSFAAAVSATLRRQGLRPLPSGTPLARQGVRVRRGPLPGTASVHVDIEMPRRAARIAADIAEVLAEAGYTVEPNELDPTILNISKEQQS